MVKSKAPDRGGRDESGFTLMELIVVTSILMIVMTAILNMLDSATKQERRTTAVVDNQNATMIAFNEITRETRGANPIEVVGLVDSSSLATSLTISVGSQSAGDRKHWRFEKNSQNQLVKQQLDDAGNVIVEQVLLTRIVNSGTEPVFRYFSGMDDTSQELYTVSSIATANGSTVAAPGTLQLCAVRIKIHLRVQGETVAPVYDATTDTEIRNKIPGAEGSFTVGGLGCS